MTVASRPTGGRISAVRWETAPPRRPAHTDRSSLVSGKSSSMVLRTKYCIAALCTYTDCGPRSGRGWEGLISSGGDRRAADFRRDSETVALRCRLEILGILWNGQHLYGFIYRVSSDVMARFEELSNLFDTRMAPGFPVRLPRKP